MMLAKKRKPEEGVMLGAGLAGVGGWVVASVGQQTEGQL